MKTFKLNYYGNQFIANVPETVSKYQRAKVGNITVLITYHTAISVLTLQTFKSFEKWVKENNLILDKNAYRYLSKELEKLY